MSLADFFLDHPVFTRETFVNHLRSRSGRPPRPGTVASLLRYHQQKGRIINARRGLYMSVWPGTTVERSPVDPYLVASQACPMGVLGYHSALELHGLAQSVFEEVQILAPGPMRPWTFRGIDFKPVEPRAALGALAWTLGVERMLRDGLEVPVTTLARTLVDVLDRADLAGGWEEVWRSLEWAREVDEDELLLYVRRLGNATLAATVGYFLEKNQDAMGVSEGTLQALESLRPRGRHYLERKSGGRLARRWNLIVPEGISSRVWEEIQ